MRVEDTELLDTTVRIGPVEISSVGFFVNELPPPPRSITGSGGRGDGGFALPFQAFNIDFLIDGFPKEEILLKLPDGVRVLPLCDCGRPGNVIGLGGTALSGLLSKLMILGLGGGPGEGGGLKLRGTGYGDS